MQLRQVRMGDARESAAKPIGAPPQTTTPPAVADSHQPDPYRMLPLHLLKGPHHLAFTQIPQGWSGDGERNAVANHLTSLLRQYPTKYAMIAAGPTPDGNTSVMVATRPAAMQGSSPEGIYGIMADICSHHTFKKIAQSSQVYDGIHPLAGSESVHEFRLPGRHMSQFLQRVLSDGIAPNQREQLRELVHGLPSGRRCVILVVGPSGAGKTSLIHEIAACAGKRRVSSISGDMYYRDKDDPLYPRNAEGNYDMDNPQALHMDEFAADVDRVVSSGEGDLPIYDFTAQRPGGWRMPVVGYTGMRVPQRRHMDLGEDGILVVDSVHAMSDEVVGRLHAHGVPYFTVYVDAERAEDRLLRCIVRDFQERKASPEQTLKIWDNSKFPAELLRVRPNLLKLNPARDLYYVTRFNTDLGLSRADIDQRVQTLTALGIDPSYAAFARPSMD